MGSVTFLDFKDRMKAAIVLEMPSGEYVVQHATRDPEAPRGKRWTPKETFAMESEEKAHLAAEILVR